MSSGKPTSQRRRLVNNAIWLFSDKLLLLIDALLVGAMAARYLGPNQWGLLSYANSILAIATIAATLGADSVVARELIREPDKRNDIFWSILSARAFASIAIYIGILVLGFSQYALGLVPLQDALVLITICSSLVSSPFLLSKILLEIELLSKWQVLASNLALIASSVSRILLVVYGFSVLPFAMVIALATITTNVLLFSIAKRLKLVPELQRPNFQTIRRYAQECWPLLVGAISVGLYMNIDVVLLKFLSGTDSAGIYSVATRLSSIWYILPTVLATTIFPSLARYHAASAVDYDRQLARYFDISCLVAYACIFTALLAFPTLLRLLYGFKYEKSISIFCVHIWALPFVFLGVARAQHLILESLHMFNLTSTLLGAIVNLALNLLLIPTYGPSGSAIATVVGFAVSAYLSSFFSSKLRKIAALQTSSIFLSPWRLATARYA